MFLEGSCYKNFRSNDIFLDSTKEKARLKKMAKKMCSKKSWFSFTTKVIKRHVIHFKAFATKKLFIKEIKGIF